jgi:hypothetical protein
MTVHGQADIAVGPPTVATRGFKRIARECCSRAPFESISATATLVPATGAATAHIVVLAAAAKFCEKSPSFASPFCSAVAIMVIGRMQRVY